MAEFIVTITPEQETTIWRIDDTEPGAIVVQDPSTPTPDELTEIIGRAAELAFDTAENPAQVADLAVRIQTRLVGKLPQ